MRRFLALAFAAGLAAGAAAGQEAPGAEELLDALLAGLLGDESATTGEDLQREVAEIGGVPFRQPVALDYLDAAGLSRYLGELVDTEYPPAVAEADQRSLVALDLLAPGTDLRALRTRLLLENVVGFYDERPGRKRLYAVSANRSLTPMNRIVLVHELRHALQDQYADVHGSLPKSVGDFDDRRLAFLSVLEGDATLLMTRYLERLLPIGGALSEMPLPEPPVDGAPPILRDQLVKPYLAGLEFARALDQRGGAAALREAWSRPPLSSEQVLHPEKYFSGEQPRGVSISWQPAGGRLLLEGVLGEVFTGTLLGGAGAATEGWGGDAFRCWDVGGRTLLVLESVWDTPGDEAEFRKALGARFEASHGPSLQKGPFRVMTRGAWRLGVGGPAGATRLVSSDSPEAFEEAIAALSRP
jgi:hypothetical protein